MRNKADKRTAEQFHHDLTLQFGVLAGDCESDNKFLDLQLGVSCFEFTTHSKLNRNILFL